MQSHDLAESSLQRLSSVSPARFKSALATSRRLLESAEASSPSGRRKRPATSSPTTSPTKVTTADAMSPFQTPRKKFKYTSGLDLTGLVHAHSPSKGSPLKQSVTPSKRREKREIVDVSDSDNEVEATPTKRRTPAAATTTAPRSPRSARQKARDQKEKDGKAAFLALRPGASDVPSIQVTDEEGEDDLTPRRRSPVRRLVDELQPRPTRKRTRVRMDWTFRETVWASFDPEGEAHKRRRAELEEILRPFENVEPVDGPAKTVDEIVLEAWRARMSVEEAA